MAEKRGCAVMNECEKERFSALVSDVLTFYRQDVTPFGFRVWWQACQTFDFDQVSKAMSAHCMDAERGQWAPKPADIVRHLHGTHSDRSLIAWGKVLDAAQRVGAYTSVCFDDGLIHAAIEDIGGWVAVCRSETDELPFLQRRFCDSYRAYARRPDGVSYPARLIGEHDLANAIKGYGSMSPTLIGDPDKAQQTMKLGSNQSKTQITNGAEYTQNLIGGEL